MTTEATPTQKPAKKKPGPKPRKGTDAAISLRDIYTEGASDDRKILRVIVESGYSHTQLREIADALENIDDEGTDLAVDFFDVIDKRTGA